MNLAELDHLAIQQKFEEASSKKHSLNSKLEQQLLEARILLWKLNYKDSLKIIKEIEGQLMNIKGNSNLSVY